MIYYTLAQAIDSIPNCPMCKEQFAPAHSGRHLLQSKIIDYEIVTDGDWLGLGRRRTTITFILREPGYEDKFIVDIDDVSIRRESIIKQVNYKSLVYGGTYSVHHSNHIISPPTTGTQYLAIGMNCQACRKYDYLFQILVDLESLILIRVALNSEQFTFQNGPLDGRVEIRNVYSTNKTIYHSWPAPRLGIIETGKRQEFPLIPMNREEPEKTLKRINNLLIFT